MARPDAIRDQLRETQRDFAAAVLAGDECDAAGCAELYQTLAQWAHTCGITAPPLRLPAQPKPPPEPTDPRSYVIEGNPAQVRMI